MASRATLAVADDDEELRATVAEALRDHGYEVLEAADGTMLLGILRRTRVSLVITDLSMPRLTGIDVLGLVRASGDRTPFVFVTGMADLFRDEARRWPKVAVLEKPIELDVLLATVRDKLELSDPSDSSSGFPQRAHG